MQTINNADGIQLGHSSLNGLASYFIGLAFYYCCLLFLMAGVLLHFKQHVSLKYAWWLALVLFFICYV